MRTSIGHAPPAPVSIPVGRPEDEAVPRRPAAAATVAPQPIAGGRRRAERQHRSRPPTRSRGRVAAGQGRGAARTGAPHSHRHAHAADGDGGTTRAAAAQSQRTAQTGQAQTAQPAHWWANYPNYGGYAILHQGQGYTPEAYQAMYAQYLQQYGGYQLKVRPDISHHPKPNAHPTLDSSLTPPWTRTPPPLCPGATPAAGCHCDSSSWATGAPRSGGAGGGHSTPRGSRGRATHAARRSVRSKPEPIWITRL